MSNTTEETKTDAISAEVEVVEGQNYESGTLPSGLQYTIKDLSISEFYEFQRMVVRLTNSGKKPEGAIDAMQWLATKMFVIEGKPITIGMLNGSESRLTFRDGSFISDVLGKYMPESQAQKDS